MNTNYHPKHSIKLLASCAAAVLVASAATSQAALTYNTTVQSTVTIPTSTFTGGNRASIFTHVRARIVVAGATETPFDITSITLTGGDGVISSINLGDIQVTSNTSYFTNYFELQGGATAVDFANSSLSFVVESTSAANNGATITARLTFADTVDGDTNVASSSVATVTAVPEPGAISIAALFAAGALLRRNRRSL
jgi:hypothetical protein